MSTENQILKTQIIIIVIALIGVVGNAVITNWYKFFLKPIYQTPVLNTLLTSTSIPAFTTTTALKLGTFLGSKLTQQPSISPRPSSPLSLSKSNQRYQVNDITFDLQRCQRSGQTIRCYFLVTNQGADLDLGVDSTWTNRTRLIDSSGTPYTATRAELGAVKGSDRISDTIIRGGRLKMIIDFAGVPIEVNKVDLTVAVGWGSTWELVKIPNVVFSDLTQQPSISPRPSSSPSLSNQRYQVNDITFDLQRCQRSGQTIRCYFLITNQGADLDLGVDSTWTNRTRLIDSSGTPYTATRAELGAVKGSDRISDTIIRGGRLKMIIDFAGVPTEVNEVDLTVAVGWGSTWELVKISNVVFSN
ncbi:MAG: hypothetical protein KME21_21095 [Desmonostoc vinosum HA7617-LM4]|jgi:uncharacterized protein YjhX (UPF0386 family)|nr:hypothetical protein [Desmonostoc vinosum HA7617-LM4]